ncbi:MAG: DUF3592 domain-containing protein [Ruminococcus sp.]|nr:DUF3592 domain-containing protein [Ruminococcus sp.]
MTILLIAGLLVLVIGIILCIAKSVKLSRAEQFSAVIIGLRDKTVASRSGVCRVFCPVVKFRMYGTDRTSEYYTYVKMSDYHHREGERVNVLINRSSPKVFYFADDRVPSSAEGTFLIFTGIILAAAGAVMQFL